MHQLGTSPTSRQDPDHSELLSNTHALVLHALWFGPGEHICLQSLGTLLVELKGATVVNSLLIHYSSD